jgi:hypothetical protein
LTLREEIATGGLGRVYALEGDYLWGRVHKLKTGWRRKMPFYSIILGAGIHMVDLVCWLSGDFVLDSVFAAGNRISTEQAGFEHNDFVIITMLIKSGVIAKVTGNAGSVAPHLASTAHLNTPERKWLQPIVRSSTCLARLCARRRVVQIFIENAIRGEEVVIHGDGSDRLDFTYIGDFVQGIVKFIENEKARDEVFNLTYGESRTIGELSDLLKAEFPRLKVTFKPKDKLTPDRGPLSVAKARDPINYEPQFPIDKGLPRYIHWYLTLLETPGYENMRADLGMEDKQERSTSS